jgi:site-specific recombinase XerD
MFAIPSDWDWPRFWDYVHTWMREQGYAHSTAILYRQVLRNLAHFTNAPPAAVNRTLLDHYFARLGRGHCSPHWTAVNLSSLRTVFDKLFGLRLLDRRAGPRHPDSLPDILSQDEALAVLDAATTLRDQLLIDLLYGCGLTVGELRTLRWQDLDPEMGSVHAPGNLRLRPRRLKLPEALHALVCTARTLCPPTAFVFAGQRPDRPLSTRHIQYLVRNIARRAGVLKPVSPATLRHTYAVHALEAGANIRELQTALGHRSVRTTLRYTRCVLPPGAVSPLDDEPIPADPPATAARPAGNKLGQRTLLREGSALARLARTPAQFLHLLRSQLGARLFATRRPAASTRCHREPTTGPP